MIRNVYLNGKINTLLVMEEEGSTEYIHPLVEALREQAERISLLEKRNDDLMQQEKILLNLLEISATTGDIMARSLKSLDNMENKKGSEEHLPERTSHQVTEEELDPAE